MLRWLTRIYRSFFCFFGAHRYGEAQISETEATIVCMDCGETHTFYLEETENDQG